MLPEDFIGFIYPFSVLAFSGQGSLQNIIDWFYGLLTFFETFNAVLNIKQFSISSVIRFQTVKTVSFQTIQFSMNLTHRILSGATTLGQERWGHALEVGWVLWHINLSMLFDAECIYANCQFYFKLFSLVKVLIHKNQFSIDAQSVWILYK